MPRAARHRHASVRLALRRFGLSLPGAHTKAPWPGHLDLAVKDKTFAYLSLEHEPLRVGVKLPRSAALALTMPNVEPTGYGLGKSGWVTATFADREKPPVELLSAWLEESYRAQAPKTLVKQLDAQRSGATARPSARARRG
jgi:predicted DNA-binding protein (MmcQ/YjbR family)